MSESRDEFRARISSIQFSGRGKVTKPATVIDKAAQTKTIPVPDDAHGRHVGGYQIEHADGRVDARVMPETVRMHISANSGEVGYK